jgi:hypothetical protein
MYVLPRERGLPRRTEEKEEGTIEWQQATTYLYLSSGLIKRMKDYT